MSTIYEGIRRATARLPERRRSSRPAERDGVVLPPMTLPMADMTPLGSLKGRRWMTDHAREYELDRRAIADRSQSARLLDNHTYITDTVVDEDGVPQLIYWPAKPLPAGSFAAGGRLRGETAERATPQTQLAVVGESLVRLHKGQPVDALADVKKPVRHPNGYFDPQPVRGAEAVARYAAERPEILARAYPLVLPLRRTGHAPSCAFGCGREALTTAEAYPAPLAWCGECVPGEAKHK